MKLSKNIQVFIAIIFTASVNGEIADRSSLALSYRISFYLRIQAKTISHIPNTLSVLDLTGLRDLKSSASASALAEAIASATGGNATASASVSLSKGQI